MSKRDKLIQKILNFQNVSTDEAISLLEYYGFERIKRYRSGSSHAVFAKDDQSITLVLNRNELLRYQLKELQEIIKWLKI